MARKKATTPVWACECGARAPLRETDLKVELSPGRGVFRVRQHCEKCKRTTMQLSGTFIGGDGEAIEVGAGG